MFVASKQGKVCMLKVCHEGRITMWLLKDVEEDRWVKVFQVSSDEVYYCDTSIADCQISVELGVVDPNDRYRVVFFIPETKMTFIVVVNSLKSYAQCRLRPASCLTLAATLGWMWKFDPAAAVA